MEITSIPMQTSHRCFRKARETTTANCMKMATKTTVAKTMAEDQMDAISTDATEEDPTGTVTTDTSGRALDLTRH